MNDAKLRKIARDSGISLKQIAEWHFVHGPRFMAAAAPQRVARPKGTLAITDIMATYNVTGAIVKAWQRAGLKSRRVGRLTVFNKSHLKAWLAKHPIVRKPRGRPRRRS